MTELIHAAIEKGAQIFPNVSGGKDGQAMVKTLVNNGLPLAGLVYADLGRITWKEGLESVKRQAEEFALPLFVARRRDGLGLLELMIRRADQLAGKGKPFWPSSSTRYCTSDTKRDPIDLFYRNCGADFIISAEGIRAGESRERAKKEPLQIRRRITSSYYDGMTPAEAIANFKPGHRLALTWYPIFNFTLADVWATYGHTQEDLDRARLEYKATGIVPASWKFAAVYVYGNERLSCKFCVLGSCNDLAVGAQHDPALLEELVALQDASGFTFRKDFDLRTLQAQAVA